MFYAYYTFIHRFKLIITKSVCYLFLLLLVSCAIIPQEELTTYREAFLQSQRAGELLYGELNSAVIRAGGGKEASNCARNNNTPTCFDPNLTLEDVSVSNPDIRARLLALKALETYNLAIVDLLEGKRGELASTRINELRDTAAALLELASISTGSLPALIGGQGAALLGGLVKQLDSLAARQQIRASLIENAPVVDELIVLLIEDTSEMYKLYITSQGKYVQKLEKSEGRRNKAAVAERAKVGPYHDQLSAYVKLLKQTEDSFEQLVKALQSGYGTPENIRATIRESIEIKNAAKEFWAEVKKAR